MARIVVIGGTGYAGRHIVQEAASLGHEVVSISRSEPSAPVDGVTNVQGSVTVLDALGDVFENADVVVSALSPRGEMAETTTSAPAKVSASDAGSSTFPWTYSTPSIRSDGSLRETETTSCPRDAASAAM